MTFKLSERSAEHLRGLWSELGAVLTGRRTFEVAKGGLGGRHDTIVERCGSDAESELPDGLRGRRRQGPLSGPTAQLFLELP